MSFKRTTSRTSQSSHPSRLPYQPLAPNDSGASDTEEASASEPENKEAVVVLDTSTPRKPVHGASQKSRGSTESGSSVRNQAIPPKPSEASDTEEASESESEEIREVVVVPDSSPRRRSSTLRVNEKPNLQRQTENEIKLFELIELGDLSGIKKLWAIQEKEKENNPSVYKNAIDINKPGINGYTVLQMAIQRGSEDLVEAFLAIPSIQVQDSLFYAIKEGNLGMVEMILKRVIDDETKTKGGNAFRNVTSAEDEDFERARKPSKLTETQKAILYCVRVKNKMASSEFDKDISPLKLAAHVGSYDLIQFFSQQGFNLANYEDIHAPKCACEKCLRMGSVRMALSRIHYFKAACNPTYMIYSTNSEENKYYGPISLRSNKGKGVRKLGQYDYDPIFHGFNLIKMMENFKSIEQDMAAEYDMIIEEVQAFLTDLLGQCRETEEVVSVLSQKRGWHGSDLERLPRLTWAIQLGQKEFVAHPHAQKASYDQWTEGYKSWQTNSLADRIVESVLHFLLVWVFYVPALIVNANVSDVKVCAPVSRFMNAVSSYIYFLALLLFKCVYPVELNDKSAANGLVMNIVEGFIVAFVFGHIASMIKQLLFMPRRFLSNGWNIYDIVTQALFLVTFTFSIISIVLNFSNEVDETKIGTRKYWRKTEPLLLAEAFYTIATILSFGRVLRIFQLHHRLGPLQVAITYMFRKAGTAAILITLALLSFSTALGSLYKAYEGWKDVNPKNGIVDAKQTESLTSIPRAIDTLFFAMSGMSSWDAPTIIERKFNMTQEEIYLVQDSSKPHVYSHHVKLTQFVGAAIYGAFHVLVNVVLVNTLVSVMTSAGAVVFSDVDMEWKFGRSQIWLFYSRDTTLPSPFSLLEPLFTFFKPRRSGAEDDLHKLNQIQLYKELVQKLIQRYLHDQAEAALSGPALQDHVTTLRESFSEVREKYFSLITFGGPVKAKKRHTLEDTESIAGMGEIGKPIHLRKQMGYLGKRRGSYGPARYNPKIIDNPNINKIRRKSVKM